MEAQLATSQSKPGRLPGHRGGDGDDEELSPVVTLMVELFRKTVQAVEEHGLKGDGDFAKVIDIFHKLGAEPEAISQELHRKYQAGEVRLWLEDQAIPAEEDLDLAYQAALMVLTREGMLIAGRRYDPFTGRRHG